ncbi:MAG: PAS domain-containing sensor histidine kinase [Tannerellaceae bacterium]|jgi:nitrogen-specific signal transduction histidine kinase|nr:PAS domain-containing sensor histidine kinase [Tannerellaceae bacterium]
MKNSEEDFRILSLLARMAFKANDIHACSMKINPDTKEDYKDTVVTMLYQWELDEKFPLVATWDHYISAVDPESLPVFMDNFYKIVNGEAKEVRFEALVKFPCYSNTIWRDYMMSVYEYDEKGRPSVVLSCSSDIHASKSRELDMAETISSIEKADKLKSKYLADMSHEIRTPLNAIAGFAELMVYADDSEERMGYFEIIKTNNQMLMQLINDILDLSKIEADVVKIAYEPVDVNELLHTACASARLRMPPGVELIMEKGESECVFRTDPVRLFQLITNLSNNAIKHTKEGSITIGYRMFPGNRLEFYVKDTGFGIPEEKQAQLFKRFAKVNDYAEGIGLGLAICRGLVTKMGGTIWVKSEYGTGSEFIFTLPFREPAGE